MGPRLPIACALAAVLAGCAAPRPSWEIGTAREEARRAAAPPAREPGPPPAAIAAGASQWGEGRVHVVQPGETLYRVARLHGVDPDELADLNQIADPTRLGVGRELLLPGDKGRKVATAGTLPGPSRPRAKRKAQAALDTGPAPGAKLAWPVLGVLNSRFGPRDGTRHDGIDVAAPEGTPIRAAADGEVLYAGTQRGYGNLVILRHAGGLITVYAHNRENRVREGARVKAGEVIALVGRSGRATGPHLHFEVREGTKPRDPLRFLR